MMLFAISSSFITMFIGWEMLGIMSYLLIGFWYNKESPPTAARKAITTMLIGDVLMLIGIIIIGASYGTFEFSSILALPNSPALDIALILILIAALTKSAQFPFHEWLSDAMEGPTPVSAFLHSSTMVKAGVFLIAVLLPLYAQAGLLNVILVFGVISALVGVSNALTEHHIKKVLAYSTIEDLGLMFIALGFNAFYAAMIFFFVQTFYKALLFMSAGSVMRANEEREDITTIYGASVNKSIFYTMLIGVVSIAGIFPLSGFFGKGVVDAAVSQNIIMYIAILLIEIGTSVYIFRWLFITSRRSYEHEGSAIIDYNSVPKPMILAAYILAVFTVVASVAYFYLPNYLASGTASFSQITILTAVAVNVMAIIGFLVAYRIYRQGHRLHILSTNKSMYSALHNSDAVNKAYMYIVKAFTVAAGVTGNGDFDLDRTTYGGANIVMGVSNRLKRIENGQLNLYVLGFVIGLIILILAFVV